MNRLIPVIATALLVGCGNAAIGPAEADVLATSMVLHSGKSIQLRVGQRVRIGASGPLVRFAAVLGDSRCPEEVDCVWQGDAVVELAVHTAGTVEKVELHTGVEPRRATIGDHVLVLDELKPLPVDGRAIAQSEYSATLRLEAR